MADRSVEHSNYTLEADRELAKRVLPACVSSAITTVLMYVAQRGLDFSLSAPLVFSILILAVSAVRFFVLIDMRRRNAYGERPMLINYLVLSSGLFFGCLIWSDIVADDVLDFNDIITMLSAAGIAAGALSALHPKPKVARAYLIMTLGLPCVGVFGHAGVQFMELAGLLLIYLTYLLAQIKIQNKQFMSVQDAAHLSKVAEIRKASEEYFKQLAESAQETERRVRLSEQQLISTFEQSPFPSQILRADGTIKMINSAWCELWGLSRELADTITSGINMIEDESMDLYDARHDFRRALSGERFHRGAREIDPAKMGSPMRSRWIEYWYSPILDSSGTVSEVLVMFRDMTEQMEAERKLNESDLEKSAALVREKTALEASKLKSQFLANMSHEIRTPINGVMGMIGLLRDTPLAADQRDYAEAAFRSASGLLTVINDILDLSKVEAGKLDLEFEDFRLGEVFDDMSQVFGRLAHAKGVEFKCDFDPRLSAPLYGDANRIRQVLNNFVSNSIKFTHEGEISITARFEDLSENGVQFVIRVRDTGIGISDEAQKKLFQAFQQANSSTSRRYGGTGLGLSISQSLAQLMKGDVGFSSEEGRGSEFWFRVTLAPGRRRLPKATDAASENDDRLIFQKTRILVAEDNQINQVITRKALEKLGAVVDLAINGVEVLRAIELQTYDLILMDCQMPEMDGFEATRRIRRLPKEVLRSLPIIGFTAGAMQSDLDNCMAAGMDDYLSKPAKLETIVKKLGPQLQRRLSKSA